MKLVLILGTAAVLALAGCSSLPGAGAKDADDHAAHHPLQGADAAKVDARMAMMQDMHQKMQAAKTPEQRAALMQDHMKAMQDGMAMMGEMKGGMSMPDGKKPPMGGTGAEDDMMMRRMDMMEMMMQMMMDREGAKPTTAK